MSILSERVLIYFALLILCGIASLFLGLAAGIVSFVQIAAVMELTYWIGTSGSDAVARGR